MQLLESIFPASPDKVGFYTGLEAFLFVVSMCEAMGVTSQATKQRTTKEPTLRVEFSRASYTFLVGEVQHGLTFTNVFVVPQLTDRWHR